MKYKSFYVEVASPKLVGFITKKLENLGYKRFGIDINDVSFINTYSDGDYQLCSDVCVTTGDKMELSEFMTLSKDDVYSDFKKEITKEKMSKHQRPNRRMSVWVKNEHIYEIVKNHAITLGYLPENGWYSVCDGVNFYRWGGFTTTDDVWNEACSRGLEVMSLSDFLSLKPEDCFVDLDHKECKPCSIYDGNDLLEDDVYVEFISHVHELLLRITKDDVPDLNDGLCSNIQAYCDNYLSLSSFVCLSDWEYFSGNDEFPVPYCYGEQKGFFAHRGKLWDKSTKYGQMRYKLCEWLLEQCELFLDEKWKSKGRKFSGIKQRLKAIKALHDVMQEFDIEIDTTASSIILWIGNDRIDVNDGSYLAVKHLKQLIQENE